MGSLLVCMGPLELWGQGDLQRWLQEILVELPMVALVPMEGFVALAMVEEFVTLALVKVMVGLLQVEVLMVALVQTEVLMVALVQVEVLVARLLVLKLGLSESPQVLLWEIGI